MKQLALFVCGIILLQEFMNTNAHFKAFHADNSLSLPLDVQPTSAIGQIGQFDLKTSIAISKSIAFMTFLSSNPKLLCFVPPFLMTDFLTQLSCNSAVLNAIPHHVLTGFMTSLSANPALINSIPVNVFASIKSTLSIGNSNAITSGTVLSAGSPSTEVIGSPSPSPSPVSPPVIAVKDSASAFIAPAAQPASPSVLPPVIAAGASASAVITPAAQPASPTVLPPVIAVSDSASAVIAPAAQPASPTALPPVIAVSDSASAVIAPAAQPASPTALPPVIAASGEAAAIITPPGTSSQNLPGVSITKEVAASISPSPSLTPSALTADATITKDISPPNAHLPVGGLSDVSEPCKTIKIPSITLPSLPKPNIIEPASLSILSSLFNKDAGNSILESKIKSIFKLLANGNFKLPKLHVPIPEITHTNKPKILVVLPSSPLIGKQIETPPASLSKLHYKPGSLDQILNVFHKRLPTLEPISLPKLPTPTSNTFKCLPLFPKFPC